MNKKHCACGRDWGHTGKHDPRTCVRKQTIDCGYPGCTGHVSGTLPAVCEDMTLESAENNKAVLDILNRAVDKFEHYNP
jgi:hypothetical protein